jgi:hypothetical protein
VADNNKAEAQITARAVCLLTDIDSSLVAVAKHCLKKIWKNNCIKSISLKFSGIMS